MNKIEQERLEQLERCIPDIWDYGRYLYVGANEKRFHFKDNLKRMFDYAGIEVDVVEINPENATYLLNQAWISSVWTDDILRIAFNHRYPWMDKYDVVLWSHGPTCLESKEEATKTIGYLKQAGHGLLVLMCPWGLYPEDQDKKSYYDTNKFAVYPHFFNELGFQTDTLGLPDTAGSNLLAWWRK